MTSFDAAVLLLRGARTPQDVFGPVPSPDAAHRYRELAKLVHPDRVAPDRAAEAAEAFARLGALWSTLHGPATITSRTATYHVGPRLGADELAEYRGAVTDGDEVVLKIARRPTDNDLLRGEARALRVPVEARYQAYRPELRDSFTYRDQSSGADHVVNVLDHPQGMVSLTAVASAHPDGLDPRDVAWIWRRLLVALGVAHRTGLVHGAVLPANVLIQADQHGVVLTNWCFATTAGTPLPAVLTRYQDWYAPEIPRRQPATPGSDIYLATRCMLALMRDHAPGPLRAFARGCLLVAPKARPDDAWDLLAELDDVLGRIYGPRRFRPFALPATVPAWPRQGR
jgi:serine/threonine protein kinase